MKGNILISLAITAALSSFTVNAACTAAQKAPLDQPTNFNTNEHLSKFDEAGKTLDKSYSPILRASIMATMFLQGRKYDVKTNTTYNYSSDKPDEYGDWFVGAAAHQIGYTQAEAQIVFSVLKQWEGYQNTNHADGNNLSKLASHLRQSINFFTGTPVDSTLVRGGYSYSEDVYDKDPNKDSNDNSCDQTENSTDVGSGSSVGYNSGWSGVIFVSTSGICYGCDSPLTGTITDLPDQGN